MFPNTLHIIIQKHCEGPIIQTRGGLPDSSILKKWPIEIGPFMEDRIDRKRRDRERERATSP